MFLVEAVVELVVDGVARICLWSRSMFHRRRFRRSFHHIIVEVVAKALQST